MGRAVTVAFSAHRTGSAPGDHDRCATNNRAIRRSLRDLFPSPYAVTDALAFIGRVNEAEPETVVRKAMDRAREKFGGEQDWATISRWPGESWLSTTRG